MVKNVVCILVLLFFYGYSQAQQAPDSVLRKRADAAAMRMRDSLALNNAEFTRIQVVNFQLIKQKTTQMNRAESHEVKRQKIQRIENTRDSLYQKILPASKYERYLRLKHLLI